MENWESNRIINWSYGFVHQKISHEYFNIVSWLKLGNLKVYSNNILIVNFEFCWLNEIILNFIIEFVFGIFFYSLNLLENFNVFSIVLVLWNCNSFLLFEDTFQIVFIFHVARAQIGFDIVFSLKCVIHCNEN